MVSATGRRLRVGYLSPDLRAHSVSYFFEPLLAAHERDAVEITCYADVARGDAVTARLQALSEHWRETRFLSDQALAAQIASDGIDVHRVVRRLSGEHQPHASISRRLQQSDRDAHAEIRRRILA